MTKSQWCDVIRFEESDAVPERAEGVSPFGWMVPRETFVIDEPSK